MSRELFIGVRKPPSHTEIGCSETKNTDAEYITLIYSLFISHLRPNFKEKGTFVKLLPSQTIYLYFTYQSLILFLCD